MDRETADDIKRHFDVVAGGLRSEIRVLDEKGDRRFEDLGRHIEVVAEGLRSEIRVVDEKGDRRSEDLGRRFDVLADGLRSEMQGVERHFDVTAVGLRSAMQDVKRHFDVVAEGLRSDIRLVAEGVAGLDEKFTQEFVKVREEIREQIGEVKSLIGVSYGDLDRRVQAPERKPS